MGGGGKGGGSADPSGMYMAMAAAQAAQLSYNLGEQQLQWTKDVWNQQQPLMTAAEQAQIDYAKQMTTEAQQQWAQYQQYYAPLEQQYIGQAETWASPENVALTQGQAMASVASQGRG